VKIWAWIDGALRGKGGIHLEELGVKELKEENEMQEILETSRKGPAFVLKHSTTCPISAGAYRRVGEYLEQKGDAAPPFYLVKVIESRPLSNAIARESGVQHASPQLILFEDGQARWNTSHGAITSDAIESALSGAA
jgi:bacillithiol system protein YtxJ